MNVSIKLKTRNIFDIDHRVAEVAAIREWILELVEWDDTKFEMRYHSSGERLVVWFDEDRHAMLFKLKWL